MREEVFYLRFGGQLENDRPTRRRLSEIGGQEIINLYDGGRLGVVADVDILIDENTGKIKTLLVPDSKGFFSFFSDKNYIEVPWEAIRKFGLDAIIIDLEEKNIHKRGFFGV